MPAVAPKELRALAFVADLCLSSVITFFVLFGAGVAHALVTQVPQTPGWLLAATGLAVNWLYFAWSEAGATGATPGKRLFGLRVETVQGPALSFSAASARWLGRWFSALFMGAGFLGAWRHPRGHALHDLMVASEVRLSKKS